MESLIPILPHFHATLNLVAAILISSAWVAILKGDRVTHRNRMIAALLVSTVFLISYLTYHAKVGNIPFAGQGLIRPLYFALLASHVILAAAVLPLILLAVFNALLKRFEQHR
ncbi:MAG: DUF420 domain-containing protein, partial [Magnetococcales bacterium]|nr:DUF420 domain-containing protein [Magnetococcales bacterium]